MKYNQKSFISAAMYLKWWSCPSHEQHLSWKLLSITSLEK